jgi:formylglycine-generating enzyme
MKTLIGLVVGGMAISALPVFAACPSMDFNRDCFVDLEDFALFVDQWLTGGEEVVVIPGGTFQMGDNSNPVDGLPDELPVHEVTVSSFAMGRFEVTIEQYCKFLNSVFPSEVKVVEKEVYPINDTLNKYSYFVMQSGSTSHITFSSITGTFSVMAKGGRDMSKDPITWVSWYGAVAYCNWLSQQHNRLPCYNLSTWECDFTKNGYRLPTEAEWEYAARGGLTGKRFPWGNTITHDQANYVSSSDYSYDISPTRGCHPDWFDIYEPYTSPVGTFHANGYGLFDMAGNVNEFCNDWYGTYTASRLKDPKGPKTGERRVNRGGDWRYYSFTCRVSSRLSAVPQGRGYNSGFRIVLGL